MFDAQYFIDKFEKIPDDLWCVKEFQKEDKHCALGHCGETDDSGPTTESMALGNLFQDCINMPCSVVSVNDAEFYTDAAKALDAPTPKERILNALRIIKECC